MRRPAFTLVESVLAITLTMILTAAAIGGLRGVQSWRASTAVRRVQSDLLFARQAALLSGRRTLCVFDLQNKSYEVQQEATPRTGALVASVIEHPLAGVAWRVRLGDLAAGLGVSLSPSLSPSAVGFNATGSPVNSSGTLLASDVVLTFTSGAKLTVRAGSGLCEVAWP